MMEEVEIRRLSDSTSSEHNVEGDAKSVGSVAEPCVVNGCENADDDEKDPLSDERGDGAQYVEVIEDAERLTPKSEEDEGNGGVECDGDNFGNAMVIVNDQDPMDLLMPLNPSNRDNDIDTEDDSDGENGALERMTKEQRWDMWMSKYRWLLHEPCNGDFGYCLYCDVTLHIVSFKSIQQHGMSLYHQEREENYLAFKESGDALGDCPSIVEIKQEYGIDSAVAAMKYQRISQTESLNNCNWIRWMHDHSWLVRKQEDGTIGFCNYCKTSLNVEFMYLRKRHETSKGHREAERTYRNREGYERGKDLDESVASDSDEPTTSHAAREKHAKMKVEPKDKKRPSFFELVPRTSIACCKLCNIRVGKQNFRRHLNTKMHQANLRQLKDKRNAKLQDTNVSPFVESTKRHPWLTSDPNDPNLGYCTVCQRSFKYGHSEIKLTLHENSSSHKNALGFPGSSNNNDENYANSEGDENNQSDDSKSSKTDEGNDNDADETLHNENDEDDGASAITQLQQQAPIKRVARGSKEWFDNKDYPWCKPNPKDRKSMICTYCQVSLVLTTKRWGHARSLRHIAAENKLRGSRSSKRSPHFQWLHYSRNKMACCRICRVRFPNEQSKMRHEHSERHKELIKEYLKKKAIKMTQLKQQNSEDTASDNSSQPTTSTKPEPEVGSSTAAPEKGYRKSIQAIVLQYKSRYPWLSYKRSETRPNYAWCEICEVSFFVPSIKLASKHQRASRHLRALKDKKRAAEGKSPIKTQETIDDIQEQYPWLEVGDDEKYCRCRICDIRLPMKVLYRRQHDGSKRHLENVAKQAATTTEPDTNVEDNAAAATAAADNENVGEDGNNDSVQVNANEPVCLLVEDNDEVLSIKSEVSADGGENTIGEDSPDKEFSDLMAPPAKRFRTSNGFQENPVRSARKKMEHIMRNLKKKGRRCSSPFSLAEGILSSSFSIAACLTPLMQQQQQQQQALSDGATTTPIRPQSTDDIPTTSTPPSVRRDTIDLFLESIGQTLKSFPMDLVAEGKMKFMQIVYDLELRAMQRQNGGENHMGKRLNNGLGTASGLPTELEQTVNGNPSASSTVVAASSTSLIRSEPSTPSTISTNEEEAVVDNDSAMNGADDVIFVNQHNLLPSIANTSSISTNQTNSFNTDQAPVHLTNGVVTIMPSTNRNKDGTLNASDAAFKPINTSVHISAVNESGRVRCVPLNALTGGMKRKLKQTQGYQPNQRPVSFDLQKRQVSITGPHPALHSNGTGTISNNSLRHIRVNTSTQSKYITIKPVTGGTTLPQIRSNSIAATAVTSSISGVITSQNQLHNNNTSLQIRSVPK